ncbi:Wall-associated kinase family protein [Rhynchospora pubera]|uniref:Wall-associated kinase family protein n=1 Tax=Rhynchospora pubera TaxID=906938 RepID=A0AAV8GTH5_9POAL|nr:Wall-associated kinase family protein [Rhynchospora pubera]
MAPPYLLLLFPLLILLQSLLATSQATPPTSLPGCKKKCGNITVPYPFGFEPGCFREDFGLVCNESYNPPRLFLIDEIYGYEITDISLTGELHISVTAKRNCYNSSGGFISGNGVTGIHLSGSPYYLSLSNSFFAVGCPNQGLFLDNSDYFVTGCISACRPHQYSLSDTNNGSCTGVGCCQSSIPSGLNDYIQ